MQSNFCLQITLSEVRLWWGFLCVTFNGPHMPSDTTRKGLPRKVKVNIWFLFLLISAVQHCYQLPDQMMSITYSLFAFLNYQLIFRNIQLIYNSNNKQKATFCVNAPAKICWLFNINILWMSLWILFTYFQPLLWKEEWILNQWIKMFYAQISLVLHGMHRCDMVCRCGWPHS